MTAGRDKRVREKGRKPGNRENIYTITFTAFLTPRPFISSVASLFSLAFGIGWYAAMALITTWTRGEGVGKKEKNVKGERKPERKRRGREEPEVGKYTRCWITLRKRSGTCAAQIPVVIGIHFLRVPLITPACANCCYDKNGQLYRLCLQESSANGEERTVLRIIHLV